MKDWTGTGFTEATCLVVEADRHVGLVIIVHDDPTAMWEDLFELGSRAAIALDAS